LDQSVLENPETTGIEPAAGSPQRGILKWLILVMVMLIIGGGGYWYYATYLIGTGGKATPSPSVEITEAIWKTKSEKTVTDFLNFWLKSANTSDGEIQAEKARDLLTIAAQAKLATTKGANGQELTNLSEKLNYFLGSAEKARRFEIISTGQIDENTVEVKVNLIYASPKVKIFSLTQENNIWLIDDVVDYNSPVTPSSFPSPSASPSSSPAASLTPKARSS